MEMHAANYHEYGYPIGTLFWGTLIFLAVFVSCFLAWKAIERLRNRRNFDDGTVEDIEDPQDPRDQAISRPLADQNLSVLTSVLASGGLGGMNQREEEELLKFGTRKQKKAIRQRRKAREQAHRREVGKAEGGVGAHPDDFIGTWEVKPLDPDEY